MPTTTAPTKKPLSAPVRPEGNVIWIKGARAHNLKNIDLAIPRNQLVVFTGVSGSGKSSLVFDTLYAEGHRRYVESLSSYARQFLARMQKPDVDLIQGLSPAIAIEQRVNTSNPRSTVGSVTEVVDYLRLLFARIGRTISPISGQEVTRQTVTDVVEYICAQPENSKVYLLAATPRSEDRTLLEELEVNLQKGFTRLWDGSQGLDIEDLLGGGVQLPEGTKQLTLLIDRFVVQGIDEDFQHRIADSVQTAFNEGQGACQVVVDSGQPVDFSERFELDGLQFEVPSVPLFNSNNSYGACPTCEGFGRVMGIDEDLVVPDKNLSVYDGAIAPWNGATLGMYRKNFIKTAIHADFPIHRAYHELNKQEKDLLWQGSEDVVGINDFFNDVRAQSHKIQYRVLAARYRGYTVCGTCGGKRLRPEALYVKVSGYDIAELLEMSVSELLATMEGLELNEHDRGVAHRLLLEITTRLSYLNRVGLGYLSLNRKASTLSGGETQRINLATSLGSNLTGSLYILDEPSIGLHPRDGERLIEILESLRDLGNSVLVVEHDEALMRRADYLVDMGPEAGEHGGQVVFAGPWEELEKKPETLTGKYLTGGLEIAVPKRRRKASGYVHIEGAREHNLKNINVKLPLGTFTVVTGVSGSGKSTLIGDILQPALVRQLSSQGGGAKPGEHKGISGDVQLITNVELVDQNAVGRNLRSNPVTYVGAYDGIRELYASQKAAKDRKLKPLHFSFNVKGGRCETCQGEGYTTVQMQFLPDIKLLCDTCKGKRFKDVVLEVTFEGKNIYDVLQLTVDEAIAFFAGEKKIAERLQKLADVGLGYVRLGQSTSTLSGGEAQRLKLASFLDRKESEHTLYIFDEPTTGLHFHDIQKLLDVFNRLVEQGNTVLVIEHNLDLIKCADWIVDLGPEGGDAGGHLVFAGTPEGLVQHGQGYTAGYLKEKMG